MAHMKIVVTLGFACCALSKAAGSCKAKTGAEMIAGYRAALGCPSAAPTGCACQAAPVPKTPCNSQHKALWSASWSNAASDCITVTPDKASDWSKHNFSYPSNYASTCAQSGKEPGSYHCTTVQGQTHSFAAGVGYNGNWNSQAWCTTQFCWVNPCTCNKMDMVKSSWLNSYYSYSQCGAADTYTPASCDATTQGACVAQAQCKWDTSAGGTITGGSTGTTGGSSTATSGGKSSGGAATTSSGSGAAAATSSGAAATTGAATTGTTSGSSTVANGTAAVKVTVTVTIKALNYTKLMANNTLKATLTDTIKTAFLAHLPTGYTKAHLKVVYSAGSVKAHVEITAMGNTTAASLNTHVTGKQSVLATAVTTGVKAMPGAAALLEDGKTLNDLTVAVAVVVTTTTAAPSETGSSSSGSSRTMPWSGPLSVSSMLFAAMTWCWITLPGL